MAQTFYSQNLELLRQYTDNDFFVNQYDEGDTYKSVYIGSWMYLDPCGRYHHVISPNGLTQRCANFWESLDKAAERLNGWVECGEGDPTDIFFCKAL
ncbi:MAG: hypothetical protein ACXACY_30995 [Candidatus Hodarchaeales archaeon]|jgi:hypothetical protein